MKVWILSFSSTVVWTFLSSVVLFPLFLTFLSFVPFLFLFLHISSICTNPPQPLRFTDIKLQLATSFPPSKAAFRMLNRGTPFQNPAGKVQGWTYHSTETERNKQEHTAVVRAGQSNLSSSSSADEPCGNKSLVKSPAAVSNMPDSQQHLEPGDQTTEKKEVEACQRHGVLSTHAITLLIRSKEWSVCCIYQNCLFYHQSSLTSSLFHLNRQAVWENTMLLIEWYF